MTSGSASISQSGPVTNIDQSTQKASINWQGFSIGRNETVNFNQPNSSALTLNRVIGNEKSVIEGALNANGQVFLINSNGMLFTKGSSVNTGGFVGSTLNLSDEDFKAGNYVFKSNGSTASIINLGTLTAKDGGYVALLGNSVSNQGVIVATKGTAALSAGDRITLNFNGDSLLSVSIDEGTLNALVENKQAIYADGGTVYLTAKAADELLGAQVNNSGIVQARTVDDLKGKIELYAHSGTAHVDGTLDASAPTGGDGGFIETSGDRVNVADSAFVTTQAASGKTGTWLIDPNDFVVAASGGNMTGKAVGNALVNNNYTIDTHTMGTSGRNGDITINDAITWSSDNSLTLTAERNININNAITANGASAVLAMNYGGDYYIRTKASYAGTELDAKGYPVAKQDTSGGIYGSITFNNAANKHGLIINGQTYTLIHSMAELDALDKANSTTNLFVDGVTSIDAKKIATQEIMSNDIVTKVIYSAYGYKYVSGWGAGYYNPNTQAYVAGYVTTGGTCGSGTCWYNPETNAYDLAAKYAGNLVRYYQDAQGKYTIAAYDGGTGKYYDPSTGIYNLTEAYPLFQRVYKDPNTGLYTKYSYDAVTEKYYDPTTNTYHLNAEYPANSQAVVYYNPVSGLYDKYNIIYDANNQAQYYNPATGTYSSTQTNAASYFYFNPETSKYDLLSPYAITGYYAIAKNLDASGTTYASAPISILNGTLVGLGHKIDHLTMTATGTAGLVAQSAGITIRDLGLENVDLSYYPMTGWDGSNYFGAFLGKGSGTLQNIYGTGTLNFVQGTAGGLVGALDGNVVSSYSDVDVGFVDNQPGSGAYVGSLAGRVTGAIKNSHATGDVILSLENGGYSVQFLGGLAGGSNSVSDSYATGEVSVKTIPGVTLTGYYQLDYFGGLVGSSGNLTNSFATGNVTGGRHIGGLAGSVSGSLVENVYAKGNVTSLYGPGNDSSLPQELYAGGLFGIANANLIRHVYSTGNVSLLGGGTYAGGLIGSLENNSSSKYTLSDAYATGNVSVAVFGVWTAAAGGLIGSVNKYDISDVTASGDVSGNGRVGGLIGQLMNSSLKNAYSDGSVSAAYFDPLYGAGASISYVGNSTTSNVYYNGDKNSGTPAFRQTYGTVSNDVSALNGKQTADARYYVNGTIEQVLADRAAAIERQQAFQEAGAQVATRESAQVLKPSASTPEQIQSAAYHPLASSLDQNIVFADARSFSVDIRRIELDGKTFILNEEEDGKGKAPAVPAR